MTQRDDGNWYSVNGALVKALRQFYYDKGYQKLTFMIGRIYLVFGDLYLICMA